MPYITSVERIGYKRGESSVIARQIAKKFSSDAEQELPKLEKLGADDLLDLAEEILDFESQEALYQWIDQRIAQSKDS